MIKSVVILGLMNSCYCFYYLQKDKYQYAVVFILINLLQLKEQFYCSGSLILKENNNFFLKTQSRAERVKADILIVFIIGVVLSII